MYNREPRFSLERRGFCVGSVAALQVHYITWRLARLVAASRRRGVIAQAPPIPLMTWQDRITVDPAQCGGRPCIRGMRIRVIDVLDLLSAGLSPQEVVAELPDLELADVRAALHYTSSRLTNLS